MIVSSLLITTLAAASLVFAAPAISDNDAGVISRWSLKDSQSVPQIIDTGRSQYKNRKRETNAERMARGLPPLKPRKLFGDGTKVSAALQPRTSIAPINTILVYDSQGRSGTLLGYLSGDYLRSGLFLGCYYITTSCSASIRNPIWHSSTDLLENPVGPGFPGTGTGIGYYAIGGTTRSTQDSSWDYSQGYNVAYMSGVPETLKGAAPYFGPYHSYQNGNLYNNGVMGGDKMESESNIWDCSDPDGECIPYWITPSKTRKSAYIVYHPFRQNMLLLTSNIDKLHTEGAFEDTLQVRMFLQDNYICPS